MPLGLYRNVKENYLRAARIMSKLICDYYTPV